MEEERLPWAKALKTLRLACGWKLTQLARAAGLSVSAITRYENADRCLKPEEARRLVSLMGYPPHLWEHTLAFVAWAGAARASDPAAEGHSLAARVDAIVGEAGEWVKELVRESLAEALNGARGVAGKPSAVPRRWPPARRRARGPEQAATPRVGAPSSTLALPPIGKAIAILQVIRGWERRDLAAAVGRPEATLANYEYGKTKPPLPVFHELLAALGFPLAIFEATLDFVRSARVARQLLLGTAEDKLPAQIETIAVQKARRIEEMARHELNDLTVCVRLLASRAAAPASWTALSACPEASRQALVRQVAEFQTAGFCELLCQESLTAAGDSARRAGQLAELAVAAAELAGGSPGLHSRLCGFAGLHLANAKRVAGRDLPAAGAAFDRALVAWEAGAADDPGLLNAARVHGLTASMRRAQRRLPEALAALDEGLRIDRWGETPALLLAKARALVELGEFEASVDYLQQAAACIDGKREPRKLYVVENLLVSNLCRLGQYAAAERRLRGLRQLALQNQLDLLRVDWLAGRIAAGLGRQDEAIAMLLRVRGDYLDLRNAYDAALVTLELAAVYAGLGDTAQVKALARESAPIFEDQQVHREAQRALALFRQAAEEERATAELLRSLIVYLYRARHDPQLRFAAAAVVA